MNTTDTIAAAREREDHIIALRERSGWTFERIGENYGFSKQRAYQLYMRAKQR